MAINKKEKRALNDMWDKSEETGGMIPIPDGKYHFKIIKAKFEDDPKPAIVSTLEVVGGDEECIGEKFDIKDNLETGENMGWFKNKLTRLGIDLPDSFDEIEDGTVAKEMAGKVFEGQAKTKGGFQNVYINKLMDSDEGEEEEPEEEEEGGEEEEPEEEEEEDGEEKIEKDDEVTWTSKGKKATGTVIEVFEDEGKARVKKEADGKVYRLSLDKLSPVYEEDEGGEGSSDWPEPSKISKMKKAEISKLIEGAGLKGDLKNGKAVATTIAKVKHDEGPSKTELIDACKAFGLKPKSKDKVKDLTTMLNAEIDAANM